jgi:hypothetical protein
MQWLYILVPLYFPLQLYPQQRMAGMALTENTVLQKTRVDSLRHVKGIALLSLQENIAYVREGIAQGNC